MARTTTRIGCLLLASRMITSLPAAEVESPDAYRYFTAVAEGTPQWSADPADVTTIIKGGVGEPSVIWNDDLVRGLITHQRDNADVVLRDSPTPITHHPTPASTTRQKQGVNR